ncbi:aminoglycoside phosphotransferase [Variovorax paradoxus]|uniref:aminoglycoside phosphotransferase n=1 Tax=Variovorax paradoxus TaxID=34073 RepID=UPI000B230639
MPQDTKIPVPNNAESRRAQWQALAERVGVLVPGSPLTEELVAFADGVIALQRQDRESPFEPLR